MSQKSKLILPPGVNARLFQRGIIRVKHRCINPIAAYREPKSLPDYLGLVNHKLALNKREYKKALAFEEDRLNQNVRRLEPLKLSLAIALQGRDGAGKSGATKKIVTGLDFDMKVLGVVPVGPPTDEERNQAYLLRFFERDRMPAFGQVRVFDRSWAEELLVVPVMKLSTSEHVQDAYGQINTMEWLVTKSGGILVKIWLDITQKEQEHRFKARQEEKPWKYGEADKEARKHWADYTRYANKMFHLTGTTCAPWHIIPSDDKRFSRVTCLRVINNAVEQRIRLAKKG